jgi:hypothetical protein
VSRAVSTKKKGRLQRDVESDNDNDNDNDNDAGQSKVQGSPQRKKDNSVEADAFEPEKVTVCGDSRVTHTQYGDIFTQLI